MGRDFIEEATAFANHLPGGHETLPDNQKTARIRQMQADIRGLIAALEGAEALGKALFHKASRSDK